MEIRRTTTVDALTTDGRVMIEGMQYVFNTTAGCFVGEYMGLSKKGALQFKGIIGDTPVGFNVMPHSVKEIYESYTNVKIKQESEVSE